MEKTTEPGDDGLGNFKGETCLPEHDSSYSFHSARYRWASASIAPGAKVLDVGCGIGYGSQFLTPHCSQYVGFDINPSRKIRAERDYAQSDRSFLTHSADDPFPFDDNTFDASVCFEAIEHIIKDWFAIHEIARILKPEGVFVCSTPINKGQEKGHFHIREYTVEQFQAMINSSFEEVSYFGQPHGDEFKPNGFEYIYICCIAKKPIKKEFKKFSTEDGIEP